MNKTVAITPEIQAEIDRITLRISHMSIIGDLFDEMLAHQAMENLGYKDDGGHQKERIGFPAVQVSLIVVAIFVFLVAVAPQFTK